MKGPTLVGTGDPNLIARGNDFGLKVASNIARVFTEEDLKYWEQNLDGIQNALRRGFSIKQEQEKSDAGVLYISPQTLVSKIFKLSDTDLAENLFHAEAFAKKHFGLEVKLEELFHFPETILWQSVLPVFVPAGKDNRQAVDLLSKATGKKAHEEADVMKYSGSSASDKHSLFFINNSLIPDVNTMRASPNNLVKTGKTWLSLKGYALAMALRKEIDGLILDRKTFTWFPEERLSTNEVARGNWDSGNAWVWFDWHSAGSELVYGGARLAVEVPLKT